MSAKKKKKTAKRSKSKTAARSTRTNTKKTSASKKKTAKKAAARKPARKNQSTRRASSGRIVSSESGAESGDLQGLSRIESADSESVDELLEEGNAFEADAVAGVEHADDEPEREVHTHEVPEDDVPEEYLDRDQ